MCDNTVIFVSKTKKCGCIIKNYAGGTRITIGCDEHKRKVEYICPVCGKQTHTKKELEEHRWEHAI